LGEECEPRRGKKGVFIYTIPGHTSVWTAILDAAFE
jgi:hypothetical protein